MNHIEVIAQVNSKLISDPRYTCNIANWVEFIVTRMSECDREGQRLIPTSINLLASLASGESSNIGGNVRDKLDVESTGDLFDILVENNILTKEVIFESPTNIEEHIIDYQDDLDYYLTAWKFAKLAQEDFANGDITKEELEEILDSDDATVVDFVNGKDKHRVLDVISYIYEFTDIVDVKDKPESYSVDDLKLAVSEILSEELSDSIFERALEISTNK